MKNQYFGDVSDYRKYGLLRVLAAICDVRIGICWMLTADDGRTDGKYTQYLSSPNLWRKHDPQLFDSLVTHVQTGDRRIQHAQDEDYVPESEHFLPYICDDLENREPYMNTMLNQLGDCDLIFFDPDNGLEVRSVQKGNKNSSKYIYWDEIEKTFQATQSLLLYQHFRRVNRKEFIRDTSLMLIGRLDVERAVCFRTSHVAFFLISNHRRINERLDNVLEVLRERWGDQFEISIHSEQNV